METASPNAASRRLTQVQAATYLGVAQRTLEDWRTKSAGPSYFKLGKRVVYDQSDLDAYLARNRVTTKATA